MKKKLERESVMSSMNLADLEDYIHFDTRLKHKFLTRTTQDAEAASKFFDKWVDPLTNLALLVYFVVVPLMATPEWCSKRWADWSIATDRHNFRLEPFYDCQWVVDAQGLNLEMADIPYISPLYAECLNIICLLTFCWSRWYLTKFRRVSQANQRRIHVLYVIAAICISLDLWSIHPDDHLSSELSEARHRDCFHLYYQWHAVPDRRKQGGCSRSYCDDFHVHRLLLGDRFLYLARAARRLPKLRHPW